MGEELIGLIDFCKDGFDIKDDRISLIGYSMGGTGAIELAAAYPSVFSKVVAIGAGIDGITNSTRPYIQNVGDYELRDDIYASLRVVKKNNSDQYEPDTMKYLYAPEENRYRAVTNNEILQAEEFKKSRIAAIAEALKNSNTKFWIISGGKDIEIDISIPTSLCGYFDEDKVKFEIKEELSHAKLVEACPEMRDKLWSFLVG